MIVNKHLCECCNLVFFTDAKVCFCPTCGSSCYPPQDEAYVVPVTNNIRCRCPHEDCGAEFVATLGRYEKTTCCPECGRQQSPHRSKE